MALNTISQWVDAPGCRTRYEEGAAKVLQLQASKRFTPEHSLSLGIYKVSLYGGCNFSSKILPLVVQLSETQFSKRDLREERNWHDIYSFDNNGILLSHGYIWKEAGQIVADEQHDLDITRLLEHQNTIKELIGDYPDVGVPLLTHTTFIDLRNGMLDAKRCGATSK